MNRDFLFYIYLMSVCILGMAFYLFGFFPMKTGTGNRTAETDYFPAELENPDKPLYKRNINRLVFMVVDGMRYDFVAGDRAAYYMPSVNDDIENDRACLVKTRVEPPTVTMPRLKSMLTGSVSNFVDVVLNFGGKELTEDNVIHRATTRNMKIVFYGDDTWLSLLPESFHRSNGTTSFFITDYTEVDNNVTYNLVDEMKRTDWDVMILHFLGLDHIGHLEGPRSTLVPPKLMEMDEIYYYLTRELNLRSEGKDRDLLIVTGDHGMKDSGGHGGTTDPEIYVPLVVANLNCSDFDEEYINQVDLAAYLSVLLGLSIPNESIGTLHPELLPLPDASKLFALHYNAVHLLTLFGGNNSSLLQLYDRAKNLLMASLNRNESDLASIAPLYKELQQTVYKHLSKSSQFDIYSILIANVFFVQIVVLLALNCRPVFSVVRLSCVLSLSLFVYCFHHMMCFFLGDSVLCKQPSSLIPVFITFICCLNFSIIKPAERFQLKPSSQDVVLCVGAVLHLLSVSSTSLIEEEHQLWYFLFSTLCVLMFHLNKSGLLLLLISHKILRCINQTGDRWASLPDIGDWFNRHENIAFLSLLHVIALSFVLYYLKEIKVVLKPNFHTLCFGADVVLVFLIYVQKTAAGICYFPLIADYLSDNGVVEARVFFVLLLVKLCLHVFGGNAEVQPDFVRYFRLIVLFYGVLDCFILICALLYRPHNVILVPALIMYSRVLSSVFPSVRHLTILHYWLANIFYFYLGNSNSLSSIDIAPAYTGLTGYNCLVVGLLLVFHTFSPIFISFTLLIINMIERGSILEELKQSSHVLFLTQALQVLVYSVLLVLQRHHLFVWSVFSPKLLYLYAVTSVYIFLLFSSFFLVSFVLDFQRKPELPKRKKTFRSRIHR